MAQHLNKQFMPASNEFPPIGLKNYGNTCFINVILQSLTNCDRFSKLVHDTPNICSNANCALCACKSTIAAIRRTPPHLDMIDLNLQRFLRTLAICPWKNLTIGQQEDAHEFLQAMISGLNSTANELSLKEQQLRYHKPLAELFSGNFCSSIYCYECKQTSQRTEPMIGLEIDIDEKKNLVQGIEDFCRVEMLRDANAYSCPRCNKNTAAQKSLTLQQLPAILPIQLKRFAYEGNSSRKLLSFMEYPKHLDLHPFLMPSESNGYTDFDSYDGTQYTLRAFIVHLGDSIDKGHYLTYVYQRRSRRWYIIDDQQVRPVSTNEAMRQYPYVLFYEKVDAFDLQQREEDLHHHHVHPTSSLSPMTHGSYPSHVSPMHFAHPLEDATTHYPPRLLEKKFTTSPLPNSLLMSSTKALPTNAHDMLLLSPSYLNVFSPEAKQQQQQPATETLWWEPNPALDPTKNNNNNKSNWRKRTRTQTTTTVKTQEFELSLMPQHVSSSIRDTSTAAEDEPLGKKRSHEQPFQMSSPTTAFHMGTNNASSLGTSAHHSAKKATLHPSPLKQPRNSVVIHHTAKKLFPTGHHPEDKESLQTPAAFSKLNEYDHLHASHQKSTKPTTSQTRKPLLRRLLPSWLTSSYFFFTKRRQREQQQQQQEEDAEATGSHVTPPLSRKRKRLEQEDAIAEDYERIYRTPQEHPENAWDEEEIDEQTFNSLALTTTEEDDRDTTEQVSSVSHVSPSKRQRLNDTSVAVSHHHPDSGRDNNNSSNSSDNGWFGMVGRLGRSWFGTSTSTNVPLKDSDETHQSQVHETPCEPAVSSAKKRQGLSPQVFVTDVEEEEENERRVVYDDDGEERPSMGKSYYFEQTYRNKHQYNHPAGLTEAIVTTLLTTPPATSVHANHLDEEDGEEDEWSQFMTPSTFASPLFHRNGPSTSHKTASQPSTSETTQQQPLAQPNKNNQPKQQVLKYQARANSFFEMLIQQLFDADSVAHKLGSMMMQGNALTARFTSTSASNSRAPSRGTSRRVSFSELPHYSPTKMVHLPFTKFASHNLSKWE